MTTTPTLYRPESGKLLHLPGCTHLTDTDPTTLVLAQDGDRDRYAICKSCQPEIDGSAPREWFDSLDVALGALPMPLENRPRCKELAAGIAYDRIYIPSSHQYVAIGTVKGVLAYFSVGVVDLQPSGGPKSRELFPNYAGPTTGTRGKTHAEMDETVCPVHNEVLPATGVCDYCT
ncbi:hypothetical protein [Cellulomonas sp. Leaf334]|uniref:hypothetical protein n=1 Tax=Cellulomonas sp. Leaf334 TaxID=1736339 RepID=UPI0006F57EB8|nr:hypothetical protein [Cellulomonas sp. Leaf334]KQR10431.1 hypothetical protein ASF78_17240 [Cellulomonas sp. Leaf334]